MTTDFTTLTTNEIIEVFHEWVNKQHPEVEYDFHTLHGCAVGLFLKDHDHPISMTPSAEAVWNATHVSSARNAENTHNALVSKPWTMGHLAIRMERAREKV